MFLLQFSPAFGKRPCGSVKNWTLFSDPLVIKSKFTLIYFLSYKQTECTSSRLFVALVIGWCFPRNNLIGFCNNISLIWLAKCSPEPESSVWLEQWSSPITTKWWTKKTEKVLKLSMVSIRCSGSYLSEIRFRFTPVYKSCEREKELGTLNLYLADLQGPRRCRDSTCDTIFSLHHKTFLKFMSTKLCKVFF